uniref:Teretoxin Tsu6.15 n=1 Tax=Terebra subulata TaxID=89435 RepID=T6F_TERSU|nr:RecName: Full=Teretoxin Tsu6.15; Flags: Precursor [Terebra subulata]
MATSGRLLCFCLVLGLVFESLGYSEARPPRDRKRTVTAKRYDPLAQRVDCGGSPCAFGCCENDVCRELDCEYAPPFGF